METDSDDDAESPLAEEHMLSGSEEWHVYAHPSTKPWSEVVKVFNKAIGHYMESTEHVWHAHKHSKNLLFLPFDDVMRIGHFPQAKPLRKRWEKEISECLPCAMAYRRQASQYFSDNLSFDHGPLINDDAHRINRCLSSLGGATSERDMKHQEATALIALFEVLLFPRLLTRATPRLPKPLSQVAPKVLAKLQPRIHDKLPGIYLLLFHQDPVLRDWADEQVRANGPANINECEGLEAVFANVVEAFAKGFQTKAVQLGLISNDKAVFWRAMFALWQGIHAEAARDRIVNTEQWTKFGVALQEAVQDDEDYVWYALACLQGALDKVGMKFWLTRMNPGLVLGIRSNPHVRAVLYESPKLEHIFSMASQEDEMDTQQIQVLESPASQGGSSEQRWQLHVAFGWCAPYLRSLAEMDKACPSETPKVLNFLIRVATDDVGEEVKVAASRTVRVIVGYFLKQRMMSPLKSSEEHWVPFLVAYAASQPNSKSKDRWIVRFCMLMAKDSSARQMQLRGEPLIGVEDALMPALWRSISMLANVPPRWIITTIKLCSVLSPETDDESQDVLGPFYAALEHCLKSIADSGNLSVFQEDIGVQIALVLRSSTKELFSPAAKIFAALISSEYMEPFLDGLQQAELTDQVYKAAGALLRHVVPKGIRAIDQKAALASQNVAMLLSWCANVIIEKGTQEQLVEVHGRTDEALAVPLQSAWVIQQLKKTQKSLATRLPEVDSQVVAEESSRQSSLEGWNAKKANLRPILKQWETQFCEKFGRRPNKQDVAECASDKMKKLYKQYKRVKAAIKDLTQAASEKSQAQLQQKIANDQNEDKAVRSESDMQIDPANDVIDEAYTSIKINFADDQSSSDNEKGSDAGGQDEKLRESSAVKMEMDVGGQTHHVDEADDNDDDGDDDDIGVKSRKRRRITDSDESNDGGEEDGDLHEDVLDEEMGFQGNQDSDQDQEMDIEWTGTISRPSHVEEEEVVIIDDDDGEEEDPFIGSTVVPIEPERPGLKLESDDSSDDEMASSLFEDMKSELLQAKKTLPARPATLTISLSGSTGIVRNVAPGLKPTAAEPRRTPSPLPGLRSPKDAVEQFRTQVLRWSRTELQPAYSGIEIVAHPEKAFTSHEEYAETFHPLVTEEFRCQLSEAVARTRNESAIMGKRDIGSEGMRHRVELVRLPGQKIDVVENDVVLLVPKSKKGPATSAHALGIVQKVDHANSSVNIMIDIWQDNPRNMEFGRALRSCQQFEVTVLENLLTSQRQYEAITSLHGSVLLPSILLQPGESEPAKVQGRSEMSKIQSATSHLAGKVDESQAAAIRNCISSKQRVCLIHGPPGTGKTNTLLHLLGVHFDSLPSGRSNRRKNAATVPSNTVKQRPMTKREQLLGRRRPNSAAYISTHATKLAQAANISSGKKTVKHVLLCAPSNAAVDELVRRVSRGIPKRDGGNHEVEILRLGNPGKVHRDCQRHTLDSKIEQRMKAQKEGYQDTESTVRSLQDELNVIDKDLAMTDQEVVGLELTVGANQSAPGPRKALQQQKAKCVVLRDKRQKLVERHRSLRQTARNQRRTLESSHSRFRQQILNEANIICTTLSGSALEDVRHIHGDISLVIVDEAAQCVEPDVLVPLQYGCTKLILVGDPQQLQATIFSKRAADLGLNLPMFARMEEFAEQHSSGAMLTYQYRMHKEICAFPSKMFYDGRLKTAETVSLRSRPPWYDDKFLDSYVLYNVKGREAYDKQSRSYFNTSEALVVVALYYRLCMSSPNYGLSNRVAIITPYNRQTIEIVKKFREFFGPEIASCIDVGTVDGFQGQEKEIVLFSCVRTGKNIGFLKDSRRMNVALTRAKQTLLVVGHTEALRKHNIWKNLVEDAEERGRLKSPPDFPRQLPLPNQSAATTNFWKAVLGPSASRRSSTQASPSSQVKSAPQGSTASKRRMEAQHKGPVPLGDLPRLGETRRGKNASRGTVPIGALPPTPLGVPKPLRSQAASHYQQHQQQQRHPRQQQHMLRPGMLPGRDLGSAQSRQQPSSRPRSVVRSSKPKFRG